MSPAPRPRLRPLAASAASDEQGRQVFVLQDPEGLAPEPIALSPAAFELALLMDGEHTVREIQADFCRRHGHLIDTEEIEGLAAGLETRLLLDGPAVEGARRRHDDDYQARELRPASLAGGAYPDDADELRAFLSELLAPAPDEPAPAASGRALPRGLVAPHIDYARGGPTYGHAYRRLAGRTEAARLLLLGTAHRPIPAPLVFSSTGYDTPLGPLAGDEEALAEVRRRLGAAAFAGQGQHAGEHSIEFQAVLAAHCFARPEALRVVPVLCGPLAETCGDGRTRWQDERYRAAIELLRELVAGWGESGLVIAGADLAHVGVQFGDPPLEAAAVLEVAAADQGMLERYAAGDVEGFVQAVAAGGDRRRICGLAPMTVLLDVLGPAAGELLDYRAWGGPEEGSLVSFAAVLFGRPEAAVSGP